MSKFYNPSKTTPKAEGRSPRKGTAISVAVSKEEKEKIINISKREGKTASTVVRNAFFSVYAKE